VQSWRIFGRAVSNRVKRAIVARMSQVAIALRVPTPGLHLAQPLNAIWSHAKSAKALEMESIVLKGP
jgi:hypothetical protein